MLATLGASVLTKLTIAIQAARKGSSTAARLDEVICCTGRDQDDCKVRGLVHFSARLPDNSRLIPTENMYLTPSLGTLHSS
jgi:hypothetical protein